MKHSKCCHPLTFASIKTKFREYDPDLVAGARTQTVQEGISFKLLGIYLNFIGRNALLNFFSINLFFMCNTLGQAFKWITRA